MMIIVSIASMMRGLILRNQLLLLWREGSTFQKPINILTMRTIFGIMVILTNKERILSLLLCFGLTGLVLGG